MSPRATAFRLSVRDRRSKVLESVLSGAASRLPIKRPVSRSRRCVEARALPAGRLSGGGHEIVPSARHPISQTQHASSRATATLATQALLPAARSEPWRAASLLVASPQRRLTAGGTEEPRGAPFGLGEQVWKCQAASTSVFSQVVLSRRDCGGNPGPKRDRRRTACTARGRGSAR